MAKERPVMKSAFKEAASEIEAVNEIIKNKDSITTIPIELIYSPKSHDRKCYEDKEIQELAQSIKLVGLLQPIIVRKIGTRFERLVGFKRILASKLNNETQIKAIVLENISDEIATLITISENLFRSNPNIYDQTLAFLDYISIALRIEQSEIIKLLNKHKAGREITEDEVNTLIFLEENVLKNLSIKLRTFADRIRVLNINPLLIEAIQKREIAYQIALLIDTVKDEQKIRELIKKTIAEELSYPQVKKLITTKESSVKSTLFSKKYLKVYENLGQDQQKIVDEYMLKIEQILKAQKAD